MTDEDQDENHDQLKRLKALEQSLQGAKALLENPEFAVQLFEQSPDAIVIVDDTGAIRLVNQQAEFMFGYHRSEIVDQPVEMLIPEALRKKHVNHRADYAREPRVRPMGIELFVEALRKDGTTLVVEINLGALVTRSGWFVIATIRRKKNGGG